MKKENWSKGKTGGCVVTDNSEGLPESGGFSGNDAVNYYGGNLVCESVWREKDVALISAAPDMLEALQNLENDDNSIPEHAWKLVKEAIAKATGALMPKQTPNSTNAVLVAGLLFKAQSLDGEPIEMSFSEISTKYVEDDVFYYNNGIGEPVACQLSSLAVVLP